MNKESDEWMAYVEWANDLLSSTGIDLEYDFTDAKNPFTPTRYDSRVYKLAEKLKTDLEDYVVSEWFCCDCDYLRRCNP